MAKFSSGSSEEHAAIKKMIERRLSSRVPRTVSDFCSLIPWNPTLLFVQLALKRLVEEGLAVQSHIPGTGQGYDDFQYRRTMTLAQISREIGPKYRVFQQDGSHEWVQNIVIEKLELFVRQGRLTPTQAIKAAFELGCQR